MRNQVRVYEVAAIGVNRKELGGECGFPRAVGTGDDVAIGMGKFSGHDCQNSAFSHRPYQLISRADFRSAPGDWAVVQVAIEVTCRCRDRPA